MFSYKLFKEHNDKLLAIADENLVGKSFAEGSDEITVSEDFYSENRCSEEDIIRIISEATIVNAIGKDIISLMIKENIIDEGKVLNICGVPHAQIVVIK